MSSKDLPPPRDPRQLRIRLSAGDPIGVSVRRLSNSDAVVVTCPREALKHAWEHPETSRTGVYILLGLDGEAPDYMSAYVGRARNVRKRIEAHTLDTRTRSFLQAAMIVSADDQMSEGQAAAIEVSLIRQLSASQMVRVLNTQGSAQHLKLEQKAIADRLLADALLLLGPVEPLFALVATTAAAVEAKLNRPLDPRQWAEHVRRELLNGGELFQMARDGTRALARRTSAGMRVLRGSFVAAVNLPSLSHGLADTRNRLTQSFGLVAIGRRDLLLLMRDADFRSARAAACFVAGRRVCGRGAWQLVSPPPRRRSSGD